MANYTSEPKAVSAPDLPEEARLDPNLGLDGCLWLDEYIEFSRKWSPRSYDGFHEGAGLWILSTTAARRVAFVFGSTKYTNLYVLMIGRTTISAKTTAAKISIEFMRKAGVDSFLLPEDITPQSMIKEMSANGGQQGWFYDEFGAHFLTMMRLDGPYAEFRKLLRIFDDTQSNYKRTTIDRGNEVIKQPYLALLGCLTPADLAPFAKKGTSLWGDGYLARMVLIIPPKGLIKDERFPDGKMIFPESLLQPLREWNKRLGVLSTNHDHQLELDAEVKDAYYRYDGALRKLLEQIGIPDFDGSYGRLAEKALRVAALFASLEGGSTIKMKHWAKAQAIAERWRRNLHEAYKQVNQATQEKKSMSEIEKVRSAFIEKTNPTKREIEQYTGFSAAEVEQILEKLIADDKVVKIQVGRTYRYLRTSQMPKTDETDEPET